MNGRPSSMPRSSKLARISAAVLTSTRSPRRKLSVCILLAGIPHTCAVRDQPNEVSDDSRVAFGPLDDSAVPHVLATIFEPYVRQYSRLAEAVGIVDECPFI